MMKRFDHPGFLTIAYLLSRLLLAPLSPVPGAVALDPLWLFAVWLNRRAGKGWMFSLIPGLVFGDWMCGLASGQILMRLAGFLALGMLPWRGGFNHLYFRLMGSFALWSSLVPDWTGYYPLGYLYLVWVLQGIMWWGIAAPRQPEEAFAPVLPLLLVPAGLLLLHLFLPAPALWPLPQLGAHSGRLLGVLSGFFLLPPFLVWFLNRRHPQPPDGLTGKSGGRWTHLAE